MLEQLTAARELGASVLALAAGTVLSIDVVAPTGRLLAAPTITLDLGTFLCCWRAYMAWYEIQPSGDDWAPAPERPAEIRVPPLDGEAAAAAD